MGTSGCSVLEGNPNVDEFIRVSDAEKRHPVLLALRLPLIRSRGYDLVVDLPWSHTGYGNKRMLFLSMTGAERMMTANRFDCRFVTDPVKWDYTSETLVSVYIRALTALGWRGAADTSYDIVTSPDDERTVSDFMASEGIDRFILLNPEGSNTEKSLSDEKTAEIIKALPPGVRVVVPGYRREYAGLKDSGAKFFFGGGIKQLAVLVKRADYVVTVDTAVTHIADAYGRRTTVLFSKDNGLGNPFFYITHASKNPLNRSLVADRAENIPVQDIVSGICGPF